MDLHISKEIMDAFAANPSDSLLRMQGNKILVEKKGIWTWLKSHIFCPKEYKLRDIVSAIQNSDNPTNIKNEFIISVNRNVTLYNFSHESKNQIPLLFVKAMPVPRYREEYIQTFVQRFLHPYQTGEITAETDKADRHPMIQKLFNEIGKQDSLSPKEAEEIEQIAFDAYLQQAAIGAFVNLKINPAKVNKDPGLINAKASVMEILQPALEQAIPKDFPSRKVASIDKLADAAIDKTIKDAELTALEIAAYTGKHAPYRR